MAARIIWTRRIVPWPWRLRKLPPPGGAPWPELPDEVRSWIGEHHIEADGELSGLAARAVARVRNGSGSEIKNLWDESGDASGWYGMVDDPRAVDLWSPDKIAPMFAPVMRIR